MRNRRHFLKSLAVGSLGLPVITSFRIPLPVDLSPPIIPQALQSGQTLGVIAPGGAIFNQSLVDRFPSILKGFGLQTKLGSSMNAIDGHLAGSDQQRVNDLHEMFSDPDIGGIIAMRGGSGCSRILPLIDFELVKAHPKPFIGYSDITSLLIAIWAKTGMTTYHGPVGYSSWNEFTRKHFQQVLFDGNPSTFESKENNSDFRVFKPGKAEGKLIGGNLTTLTNLIGSEYLPETWDDKILFLEEIKEEPYSIDRMFMQLKLAGILDKVRGIVLGHFRKCVPEEPEKSKTLQDVLDGYLKPLNAPSCYGTHFGHVKDKFTLPIGNNAVIDTEAGTIELTEKSVM